MFWSNSIGAGICLGVLWATSELWPAYRYFLGGSDGVTASRATEESGVHYWRSGLLLLRSTSFYVGGYVYLMIVKQYGAIASTTVGTLRKIFSVVMSFLFFPKPFHVNYVIGVVCFALSNLLYLGRKDARLQRFLGMVAGSQGKA